MKDNAKAHSLLALAIVSMAVGASPVVVEFFYSLAGWRLLLALCVFIPGFGIGGVLLYRREKYVPRVPEPEDARPRPSAPSADE